MQDGPLMPVRCLNDGGDGGGGRPGGGRLYAAGGEGAPPARRTTARARNKYIAPLQMHKKKEAGTLRGALIVWLMPCWVKWVGVRLDENQPGREKERCV